MTDAHEPNESEIAQDTTDEMDTWVELIDEETGEKHRFVVDDLLDVEYKGETRSYAVLIPEEEVELVDSGKKDVVDRLVIARWVEDEQGVGTVPFESEEEEANAAEAIAEFYLAQEADPATQPTE